MFILEDISLFSTASEATRDEDGTGQKLLAGVDKGNLSYSRILLGMEEIKIAKIELRQLALTGRELPLPKLSHMAVNSRDSINLVRLLKRLENPETPSPALVRAEVFIRYILVRPRRR